MGRCRTHSARSSVCRNPQPRSHAPRSSAFLRVGKVMLRFAAPDRQLWFGRRDQELICWRYKRVLRVSEITGPKAKTSSLGKRRSCADVIGKGRKGNAVRRCLIKSRCDEALWLVKCPKSTGSMLFQTQRCERSERSWRAASVRKHSGTPLEMPFVEGSGSCPSASTHDAPGSVAGWCGPRQSSQCVLLCFFFFSFFLGSVMKSVGPRIYWSRQPSLEGAALAKTSPRMLRPDVIAHPPPGIGC